LFYPSSGLSSGDNKETDNEIDLNPFESTDASVMSESSMTPLPTTIDVENEMNVKLTTKSLMKTTTTPTPSSSRAPWTETTAETSPPPFEVTNSLSGSSEETENPELNEIKKNPFTDLPVSSETTTAGTTISQSNEILQAELTPSMATSSLMDSISTTVSPSTPSSQTTVSLGVFHGSLTTVIKSPILPILTSVNQSSTENSTTSTPFASTGKPYASHLGECIAITPLQSNLTETVFC
jgi:hypothetical protein